VNAAKSRCQILACLLAVTGLLDCGVARAEGGPRSLDLQASVTLTSDYRFRGISYSDGRPALQGGVALAQGSGWFGGVWSSLSLGRSRVGDEIDVYAGRSGRSGRLGYSLAAYAYVDGAVRRIDYAEFQALLTRSFGGASLQLEASGAPKQRRGTSGNLYLGATATIPLRDPQLSVTLHGGRENGFVLRKIDWEVGVAYTYSAVSLSASLVGSTRAAGRESTAGYKGGSGLVLSAVAAF
jgi:uncharacterized protein (TIGR02001 family)